MYPGQLLTVCWHICGRPSPQACCLLSTEPVLWHVPGTSAAVLQPAHRRLPVATHVMGFVPEPWEKPLQS